MTAAPQKGAGLGGVQVFRVGAETQLPAVRCQFPQRCGGPDSLDLPQQRGEILRIALAGLYLFHILYGDAADGDLSVLVVAGALQ